MKGRHDVDFLLSDGTTQKYLCVLEQQQGKYSGYCVDIPATVVNAKSRDKAITKLRDGMALMLASYKFDLDVPAPEPKTTERDLDLTEHEHPEVLWLSPTSPNPLSMELNQALKNSGLTVEQVARHMNIRREGVFRLLDPTYFGHTIRSLKSFCRALQREGCILDNQDKPSELARNDKEFLNFIQRFLLF